MVSPSAALTVAWARVVRMIGRADDGPVVGNGDGNALLFRLQLGFLRVDFHHHHAVRTDPRRDAQDQTDIEQFDRVLNRPARRHVRLRDPRHLLADLDEGGLIVQRSDLGAAENVQPARILEGPDQNAHALAAGREHQAAEAEFVVESSHREVRHALRRDDARTGQGL